MSQRTERVDELLRQEIGVLLAKEVADPRIGFATITDVETTPDLRHAKVWVSVIGTPAERAAAVAALAHAVPFIRHELGVRLRIKRIPELHVRLDDTIERGSRVLQLLNDLETGVEPSPAAALDETLPTPVGRLPQPDDAPDSIDPTPAGGDPGRGRKARRRSRAGGSRPGAGPSRRRPPGRTRGSGGARRGQP